MTPHDQLTVKAMADRLHVCCHYVYQMRRCGFKMHGVTRGNRTATQCEAVKWIVKHDFRIVRGKGVVTR